MGRGPMGGLPTKEQVWADLLGAWEGRQEIERVPLKEAVGRVCGEDLRAVNTLPVFRTSGCDGIAVESGRFAAGMPDVSAWQQGREYDRADTGDDFADRYDAVIPIEEVELEGDRLARICTDGPVSPGKNVSLRGELLKEGDRLLQAGLVIRPIDLAALAMGGIWMVPVRKRPRVAFIPTGSELIPAGITPRRGENIDTNSIMAEHLLRQYGAVPEIFPIIRDDKKLLEEALEEALQGCDLVIINGGTAKGGEDLNHQLLEQKGRILHHYVATIPGRPLALGIVDGKPVVNIPGPTMAAFFCMDWCVKRMVARMLGVPEEERPAVPCVLEEAIAPVPGMALLCPIRVTRTEDGVYHGQPVSLFKVRLPEAIAANGMYIAEAGSPRIEKGAVLKVELLRGLETIGPGEQMDRCRED